MILKRNTSPTALYVHIPFCAKKCCYCDFNSIVSNQKMIDQYLDGIDKELRMLKSRFLFHTVYIGGGTPSLLSENQLEKLLDSICRSVLASEIKEYTVEANPGSLTMNKIGLFKESLVNRISLGVQSFQDKQLQFLGRIHSGNDARNTFHLLRDAGFKNINIDLIFGCPNQSPDDWKRDLEIAVELNPEHISTYALTYEEGTALTRDLKSRVVRKLDEYIELAMYKTSINYLRLNGYNHYEISNFAKTGYECLHNCIYWKNAEYIGVGVGAYSFVNGVRTSNEKDVFVYMSKVDENKNTTSFREQLTPGQYASETIIMSLRLRQGISNTDFYERFGYKIEDQFGDTIRKLTKDGLIHYDERLTLTEKGLFVADTVMTEFL
ncbi:MAG: radical SAM family heme chaperone HemW [wastewater metagenome]|nr:radical SAM family heme chaperone HemW [Candidatus Loosdrechtia aerotolerans]